METLILATTSDWPEAVMHVGSMAALAFIAWVALR